MIARPSIAEFRDRAETPRIPPRRNQNDLVAEFFSSLLVASDIGAGFRQCLKAGRLHEVTNDG